MFAGIGEKTIPTISLSNLIIKSSETSRESSVLLIALSHHRVSECVLAAQAKSEPIAVSAHHG
jgi:hypothetical protein